MRAYFRNIAQTCFSLLLGLKITWEHFLDARTSRKPIAIFNDDYFEQKDGIVTLQFPFEELPVPDTGRYKLDNEIDDCIVCDKCAKVCPVNCIDIEPIRAVEEFGKTSDGTSKRIYAATFDIDMSKCCFCGLCTTVCPTECLTMTKDYDFSVYDLGIHNYEFAEMSETEIVEKKKAFELYTTEKQTAKTQEDTITESPKPNVPFRPKIKTAGDQTTESSETKMTKPVFKPKIKLKTDTAQSTDEVDKPSKPVFKPKIKPKIENKSSEPAKKPMFRPKIKPNKKD